MIHIHPFTEEAAGERATLEPFLDGAGIELDGDRLVVDGEVYENGDDGAGRRHPARHRALIIRHTGQQSNTDQQMSLRNR